MRIGTVASEDHRCFFHDDLSHPFDFSRNARLFADDIPPNFVFSEWLHQHVTDELLSHITNRKSAFSVPNGHLSAGIILTLFTSVGIEFISASTCGLILLGTLPWAPICFLTCRLSSDVVIFWKVFCMKFVF